MAGATLELVLRRDRLIVLTALFLVTAIAAAYIVWLTFNMNMPMASSGGMVGMNMASDNSDGGMAGMNMGPDTSGGGMAGMDMGGATPASNKAGDALLPSFRPWGLNDFAFIFTMWAVMMVGMMTPSATPMVLLYAMVGRSAATGGRPFAATGWFFAGYIGVWIGFSAAATLAQWTLVRLALLSPIMAATDKAVGGVILIVAGIYQWTPLKAVCLRACQGPLAFIMGLGGFRSSAFGAMQLGAKHGLYCLGCCWALMALLFVGGVMNLIWIAGLAILILLEKTLPATGLWIPRISGVVLAIAGAWLLVGAPQLA